MKSLESIYLNIMIISKSFTIYWLLIKNKKWDSAHPAGLVQDTMVPVACPAPALVPWSLNLDNLKEASEPVGLFKSCNTHTELSSVGHYHSSQAGPGQATKIKQLFTQASAQRLKYRIQTSQNQKLDDQLWSEVSNIVFLHTLPSAKWRMLSAEVVTYFQMLNEQQ